MAEREMGLKKETAATLATLFGPTFAVPILFLMISKDKYVRFWSMQALVLSAFFLFVLWGLGLFVFTIILAPVVAFINGLLTLLAIILWLICGYKAWQGDEWEVPVLGKLARGFLKKV